MVSMEAARQLGPAITTLWTPGKLKLTYDILKHFPSSRAMAATNESCGISQPYMMQAQHPSLICFARGLCQKKRGRTDATTLDALGAGTAPRDSRTQDDSAQAFVGPPSSENRSTFELLA